MEDILAPKMAVPGVVQNGASDPFLRSHERRKRDRSRGEQSLKSVEGEKNGTFSIASIIPGLKHSSEYCSDGLTRTEIIHIIQRL